VGDERHDGKYQVPIVQESGWVPGPVRTGAENFAPTGMRSPDLPARTKSLYRLSYPGPFKKFNTNNYCLISNSCFIFSSSFHKQAYHILTKALNAREKLECVSLTGKMTDSVHTCKTNSILLSFCSVRFLLKVLPDIYRIMTHIQPALQLTNLEFSVEAHMANQIMIAPYTTIERTLQHAYNKHGIIKYRIEVCYRETGLF